MPSGSRFRWIQAGALALIAGVLLAVSGCRPAGTAAESPASPQAIQPTTAPRPTATSRPTTAPRPTATSRPTTAPARTPAPNDGLATIAAAKLPREARRTLALIDRGGPFPYRQDGVVFQNRERLLPRKPQGYYHEYTVETPGSPDRGPRRLVVGQGGEIYYTDDHYNSFIRVVR